MKIYLIVLITISILSSFCFSTEVNISGIVTNDSIGRVPNALVELEKLEISVYTNENGEFHITNVDISDYNIELEGLNYKIKNGVLSFNTTKISKMELFTYSIKGELISKKQNFINPGISNIPLDIKTPGLYIHKLKIGKKEFIIKNSTLNSINSFSPKTSTSHTNEKKTRAYDLNEVIRVTKNGFIDYRIKIKEAVKSDLLIKLLPCSDSLIDIDGNVYQTVKIGDQIWSVENLRVTHYNDGTPITKITNDSDWVNATEGAYCYYMNDSTILPGDNPENLKYYGALYNWYSIGTGKLAPNGWHIPSRAEWETLTNYLIENGYNWDNTTIGNKAGKAIAAKTNWDYNPAYTGDGDVGENLNLNNKSGFTGMPAGYRNYEGKFNGRKAYWWTSTKALQDSYFGFTLFHDLEYLKLTSSNTYCGKSIRLIKD